MKKLILGLTLLSSIASNAANTVEAYHLESAKGLGYPDLLIKVLDDGTCSSEISNFDGTKDYQLLECIVTESTWSTMKLLKYSTCTPFENQDPDGYETFPLIRTTNSIEMAGVLLMKASQKVIDDYDSMTTCN